MAGEAGDPNARPLRGRLARLWRHAWARKRTVGRIFDQAALAQIEAAIAEGERDHLGEIRFAVETDLGPFAILAGTTPRQRALQVFSEHRIWDTEHNSGVLIYLLWADHAVEIVADRAAHRALAQADWDRICAMLAASCRAGRPVSGAVAAIREANAALARTLAVADRDNPDELSNRPLRL
ncbi:MAG: TPM domain-containing protein [Lautropia sp.]